ncbi:glycosyltransferase family 2 protein [Marinicauda sp. Alg238-R41]|uniref:glycosyltransferase family 2 protein n=1 Tax=Marinicauda sp. Alg238-R41 TaxID=2993447 RepID=UPI0022E1AA37|nr:glycosyltransferase family 2 protein [Marinicauda sp. Alg238-R41]
MSPPLFHEVRNARSARQGTPALSVLIPFYKDDPRTLIDALAREDADIEIVLFDDGQPDPALNAAVTAAVLASRAPARLVSARTNLGRASGRNTLAGRARADWLLFLDADMSIPTGFIRDWLDAFARQPDFDAAFGGFELPDRIVREHRVHAALASAGDVASVAQRTRIGTSAFCSSNLLVRRSLMGEVAFDTGFSGWGWEDVDWAARAARKARLVHLDIPARHVGLHTVGELLAKYDDGGANFARFLERNREMTRLPGARWARLVRRLRLASPMRTVMRRAALTEALPVRLRVLAIKFYRAARAAEAMQ